MVLREGPKPQVSEHEQCYLHKVDFDRVDLVGREKTYGGRLFKEAWHSGENAVNRHVDLHPAFRALRHHLSGGMEPKVSQPNAAPHEEMQPAQAPQQQPPRQRSPPASHPPVEGETSRFRPVTRAMTRRQRCQSLKQPTGGRV